jgi:UDP-hydrolysing UDP-N-acetyl-D-glucosamine 2-epimerase
MRKITFIITSFIHYSRNILILEELKLRKDVELHIVIGGTALLPKYSSKYSRLRNMLENDGFQNIHELYFSLEGDNNVVKAKTTGLGIIEFSTLFNDIKPDLIIVRADRFEVLSATVTARYMNIPVAHIEGGDLTGSLDDSVRHAITKLSHIHIVTNTPAQKRLVQMGEDPKYIFNFGSPDVEVVTKAINSKQAIDLSQTGSGSHFDFDKDFIMVMYHPVWQDAQKEGQLAKQTCSLLNAVHKSGYSAIWFWPNADVGAEEISHELRVFRDKTHEHKIHFMRYLPPKSFIWLLNKTRVLIGNSSAGIKECSYLGVPVVNIGTRQDKRLRASNVIDVDCTSENISNGILRQLQKKRYKASKLYYAENTGRNIARTLARVKLDHNKVFF